MSKVQEYFKKTLSLWAVLLLWSGALMLGYSLIKLVAFTGPILAHDYADAANSQFGDNSIPAYNIALSNYARAEEETSSYYKQDWYRAAQRSASQSYGALLDKDGNVPAGKAQTAAKLQLIIGNVLYRQNKLQAAAEAYAQALRHDPDLMPAKYNLELVNKQIDAKANANGNGNGKGPDGKDAKPGGKQPGQGKDGDGKGKDGKGKDGKGKDGQPGDKPGDGKGKGDPNKGNGKGKDGQPGNKPGDGTPQDGNGQPGDGKPGKQPGKQPGNGKPDQSDDSTDGTKGDDAVDQFQKPGGGAGKWNGKGL
jgi:hypothetical protein